MFYKVAVILVLNFGCTFFFHREGKYIYIDLYISEREREGGRGRRGRGRMRMRGREEGEGEEEGYSKREGAVHSV